MTRHIVNLAFGAWKWRIYLGWNGDGSGDEELAEAMRQIEAAAGPGSFTSQEFLIAAQGIFRDQGFEIFKG